MFNENTRKKREFKEAERKVKIKRTNEEQIDHF